MAGEEEQARRAAADEGGSSRGKRPAEEEEEEIPPPPRRRRRTAASLGQEAVDTIIQSTEDEDLHPVPLPAGFDDALRNLGTDLGRLCHFYHSYIWYQERVEELESIADRLQRSLRAVEREVELQFKLRRKAEEELEKIRRNRQVSQLETRP